MEKNNVKNVWINSLLVALAVLLLASCEHPRYQKDMNDPLEVDGVVEATDIEPPFTECDVNNRPQMCTLEYQPVCGKIDTGVRCVKAPCPSSKQKTLANACAACAADKVIGYTLGQCLADRNDEI